MERKDLMGDSIHQARCLMVKPRSEHVDCRFFMFIEWKVQLLLQTHNGIVSQPKYDADWTSAFSPFDRGIILVILTWILRVGQ